MHVILGHGRRRVVQSKHLPRLFTNLLEVSACWIEEEEQGRQELSLKNCHLEDSGIQLEEPGIVLNSAAAYILQLRQCRQDVCLEGVKRVHADMIRSGFVQDRYLANSLVEAYGKCGSLENARDVFDRIHERNVFSWTVLIAAYAQNGHCWEAIHLFQQMNLEGVAPNGVTLITVLGACSAGIDALKEGETVHACAIDYGYDSNAVLGTALVNMYSKHGRLGEARRIFDKMPQCDVVAWTAMITAYAHQGHGNEALNLYHGMSLEGVKPNEITLVGIAEACGSFPTFAAPQEEVHAHVVASGFESNTLVGNSLINMFSKCGNLHGARKAFDKILRKDVVSWIAVISAYTHHEFGKEALTRFKQMLLEGMIPNEATLISCLDACSCLENLTEGKTVHSVVAASRFESNPIVATALVSMYGNCGSLIDARGMFGEMSRRDVVSWTAMIAAYEHQGLTKEVLELFRRMDLDGVKPNEVTFVTVLGACSNLAEVKVIHSSMASSKFVSNVYLGTSLVSTYGKCGSMGDARSVFDAMPCTTAITWNALLTGYVSDRGNEVFELFQRMQLEGVKPNEVTFVSLLDACVNLGALAQGRIFHSRIVAEGFQSNVTVSNLLISMYGKCGSLCEASSLFNRMHLRNVISWTAVITAYAHHGHGKEALDLYRRMDLEGVKPDYVTFVSILFACSHAGMLDEGRHYFLAMVGDHGIDAFQEHYDCMVDLLGRAGRLAEVEDLITCMPFGGSAVAWMSLLGACKIHNDMERGERVGKRVSELEPENAGQYALLTNIYASAGRWGDVTKIRKRMEEKMCEEAATLAGFNNSVHT